MKKYDLYGSVLWLAMGVFVSAMGAKFGLGTPSYPGPGFFPFLVGLILVALGLGTLSIAAKGRDKDPHFGAWPSFGKRMFLTVAVLLAFAFSLEFLGYVIGSLLLMFYLFKKPGGQSWTFSLLASSIMVGLTYYFFGVLLQAQFPKGILNLG